jgi:hypothetical protein
MTGGTGHPNPSGGGTRSAPLQHPVLDHGLDPGRTEAFRSAAGPILDMSDAELLSFVPERPFAAYCECPACYGGVEGNGVLLWRIDNPDRLTCRFCGTVYPNDRYPETETLTGSNPAGETVTYTYYQNHDPEAAHFFTAHLHRHRREWLVDRVRDLSAAYHLTGDESYARPVVLVLDRLAGLYPHYPVVQNLPRRFAFRESQSPPYAWDSGRWGWFHNEIPGDLIRAYDLVYHSEGFSDLSESRGYDVRARFEDDLLRPTFDATAAFEDYVMNAIGPGYGLSDSILLGRVINEPRYVHWAYGWLKQILLKGFYVDGMWCEAPSYHYMTVGGLQGAFETIKGYTDPPGYVDPEDGSRYDAVDPASELPFWSRVQTAPTVVAFPNGCTSPIHDTHAGEKRAEPRDSTQSSILPAYGHASLGLSHGKHQLQAQLHFSGNHGHHHRDNLNLTLWAKEREILPDLGYTWTQLRNWTTCTLGHNLVVVDRQNQNGNPADGSLISYFPDVTGIGVTEADGLRSYGSIPDMEVYRRTLVTVPVSDSDAYVVDVFRVRGGDTHDWTVQGDADEDTAASTTTPLEGDRKWLLEEGEEWVEPLLEHDTHHPYGMVRNVSRGPASDNEVVTFAYDGTTARGLNLHLLNEGNAEILLGRSPSVRRCGRGSDGDMRKAYDFWMPKLLVRRRGQAPLGSVFCTVVEPFLDESFITRTERVPLRPEGDGCVALRVTHGDTQDTIIATPDQPPCPTLAIADGISMCGRLGIVRRRAGEVTGMWLFEGTELTADGKTVTAETGGYEGGLTSSLRVADGDPLDGFLTDADLPPGDALRGIWLLVVHPDGYTQGCEIDSILKQDGRTVIRVTEDHGLVIDPNGCREVYFPARTFAGSTRFRIPTAAVLAGSS